MTATISAMGAIVPVVAVIVAAIVVIVLAVEFAEQWKYGTENQ